MAQTGGALGGVSPCLPGPGRTPLYRGPGAGGDCSSISVPEPHQPCDFLEYVMRPQPFGCRSLTHQDAKNNDRSALPQREMAPLETGDGPSSTLLTARVPQRFPWAAEESVEEPSPRVNGVFTLKTSWSQQDVDKLEQVQRRASRMIKGRED